MMVVVQYTSESKARKIKRRAWRRRGGGHRIEWNGMSNERTARRALWEDERMEMEWITSAWNGRRAHGMEDERME